MPSYTANTQTSAHNSFQRALPLTFHTSQLQVRNRTQQQQNAAAVAAQRSRNSSGGSRLADLLDQVDDRDEEHEQMQHNRSRNPAAGVPLTRRQPNSSQLQGGSSDRQQLQAHQASAQQHPPSTQLQDAHRSAVHANAAPPLPLHQLLRASVQGASQLQEEEEQRWQLWQQQSELEDGSVGVAEDGPATNILSSNPFARVPPRSLQPQQQQQHSRPFAVRNSHSGAACGHVAAQPARTFPATTAQPASAPTTRPSFLQHVPVAGGSTASLTLASRRSVSPESPPHSANPTGLAARDVSLAHDTARRHGRRGVQHGDEMRGTAPQEGERCNEGSMGQQQAVLGSSSNPIVILSSGEEEEEEEEREEEAALSTAGGNYNGGGAAALIGPRPHLQPPPWQAAHTAHLQQPGLEPARGNVHRHQHQHQHHLQSSRSGAGSAAGALGGGPPGIRRTSELPGRAPLFPSTRVVPGLRR